MFRRFFSVFVQYFRRVFKNVGNEQVEPAICHIKLCLLLWFEFFRTIALLLGGLRDLTVGYSKSLSASVKCRREIFGRANFHPRVVNLGINVSSKVGDDGRRTGEGTQRSRPTEKTPRHDSLEFSTSISSVYADVLNLGILLLDNFTRRKSKVGLQVFKFCFLIHLSVSKILFCICPVLSPSVEKCG